jgi:hypothetical protein
MKKTFGVSIALVGLLAVIAAGATPITKPEGGNVGSGPARTAEGGNVGSVAVAGPQPAVAQPDQSARESQTASEPHNDSHQRLDTSKDAITTDPLGNAIIGGIVGATVRGGSVVVGVVTGAVRGAALEGAKEAIQKATERHGGEAHEHDHHDLNDAPDKDRDHVSHIA